MQRLVLKRKAGIGRTHIARIDDNQKVTRSTNEQKPCSCSRVDNSPLWWLSYSLLRHDADTIGLWHASGSHQRLVRVQSTSALSSPVPNILPWWLNQDAEKIHYTTNRPFKPTRRPNPRFNPRVDPWTDRSDQHLVVIVGTFNRSHPIKQIWKCSV